MDRPPKAIRHKPAVRQSLQTNLLERSKFPRPDHRDRYREVPPPVKNPPWREFIEAQAQLNAMAVYQDPVDNHGFGYRYNSAAGAAAPPPPARFDRGEFAPGEEAQV
jgi:hypothetical protein